MIYPSCHLYPLVIDLVWSMTHGDAVLESIPQICPAFKATAQAAGKSPLTSGDQCTSMSLPIPSCLTESWLFLRTSYCLFWCTRLVHGGVGGSLMGSSVVWLLSLVAQQHHLGTCLGWIPPLPDSPESSARAGPLRVLNRGPWMIGDFNSVRWAFGKSLS